LPKEARLALQKAAKLQKESGRPGILDEVIDKVKLQYPQYFNHDEKEYEDES